MKRILHTLLLTTLLFGCSKKQQTVVHAEPVLMSPEEAKLEVTLSRMSDRAKKEIHIDNKKQFIIDLNSVLEYEKQSKVIKSFLTNIKGVQNEN